MQTHTNPEVFGVEQWGVGEADLQQWTRPVMNQDVHTGPSALDRLLGLIQLSLTQAASVWVAGQGREGRERTAPVSTTPTSATPASHLKVNSFSPNCKQCEQEIRLSL